VLLGRDNVSVAFFGDGAVSNGAFHEGLNLAAIYQLPVVFVCENNLYATEVAFSYASRNPGVANRGPAYGLASAEVDGNDVEAVQAAAGEAVQRARSGQGPTVLECRTYRTRPHAEGMREAGYRAQAEIEAWKARDPIITLGEQLLAAGQATEDELQAIDAELRGVADEALAFAKRSPWPDPATALDHVYHQAGA
jgi:2-oxoisovalerate dehydrogenase E1 component